MIYITIIIAIIIVLIFLKGKNVEYNQVKVSELDEFMKENPRYTYIDVREASEYSSGYVKGFKNISSGTIINGKANISKDNKVVVMCQSGMRSKRVANYLSEQGYDVTNVSGGIINYKGELK